VSFGRSPFALWALRAAVASRTGEGSMHVDMQQQGRHTRLQLSGELTIYDAVALHRALLGSLGSCDSIELDLAAVTDLDAAGLQQLMLLRREARATGKALQVLTHSDATREVIALCGLDPDFGEPIHSAPSSVASRADGHEGRS
jgi:anti-anti-sigma factor